MERHGQVREQAHVTLIGRIRRRHRKSIRHQSVVIRLTEEIAPQQLPGSGCAFDFLNEMLFFRFEQFPRVGEMQFVAVTRKKHDHQNKHSAQSEQK